MVVLIVKKNRIMIDLDKIIISGIHFKLSDNTKNVIRFKCEKLLKHQKLISRLRFELEKDEHSSTHENEYIAKGHMEVKGRVSTFESSSNSIYKSIDDLIQKLDRSLRGDARLLKKKRRAKNDPLLPGRKRVVK